MIRLFFAIIVISRSSLWAHHFCFTMPNALNFVKEEKKRGKNNRGIDEKVIFCPLIEIEMKSYRIMIQEFSVSTAILIAEQKKKKTTGHSETFDA